MATDSLCIESVWERFPTTATDQDAKRWIQSCVMLGLAPNTVMAYTRAIEGFLSYCQNRSIEVRSASREAIAQYVGDLRTQPRRERSNIVRIDSGALLSNATLQQRLTAIRLFFDFLFEDGLIQLNPVGRGRYMPWQRFSGRTERSPIPKFHKLPRIPSEAQWASLLAVVAKESARNRCMFALAYDAALRREELCQLRSDDIDPAHRLLRIRAETTKSRRERILPYSTVAGDCCGTICGIAKVSPTLGGLYSCPNHHVTTRHRSRYGRGPKWLDRLRCGRTSRRSRRIPCVTYV